MNEFVSAALSYAANGYLVFPCKPKNKEPATKNGFYDATTDKETIRRWWSDNPNYNVAIRTGNESNLLVLDVDEGGKQTLKGNGWNTPTTVIAKTGKGFLHYFKYPGGNISTKVRLAESIDVKADGGYVLAPPSVHPNGMAYEWIIGPKDATIADAPEWLLRELTNRPSDRKVDVTTPIEDGERNDELTRRAGKLTRVLEPQIAREVLHFINERYCRNPLPADEVEGITIYANAPDEERSNGTLTFLNLGDTMRREIEPPEQLIDQLLYKQAIISLYAPGGSGKTIMALWIAMLVMEQGLSVVYVDEENGQLRIAERLQQLGADPDTVAEYFLYADGPGLTLDAGNLAMWEATIEQVKPALVIFDPFADLLALSNLEENSAGDVTKWIKAFAQPVKESGGAILILDHVMKDDNGKYARGSSAKHAKVDAAWKLKVEAEFDRNTVGEVSIKRDKDRLGCMPEKRKFAVGGNGKGKLKFEPGEVIESLGPRADGLSPSQHKVLSVLEKLPGMTRKLWKEQCAKQGIPEGTFKPAISKLKVRHVFEDKDKRWWPKSEVTGYERDNLDEAIPTKQSA